MHPTTTHNVFARHWAVLPSELAKWQAEYAAGRRVLVVDDETPAPLALAPGAPSAPSPREARLAALREGAASGRTGIVAVLPIVGGLRKRGSYWSLGMQDYAAILLEIAARPDVKAIVLAIDSPGGTVDGTRSLGEAVRLVNATKPVVAFADGCMCSAAYWVGSQAGVIIAEPMSTVGSIGVLSIHADFSAYLTNEGIKVTILRAGERKAEGNPYEPLPDEVRAALEAELAAIHTAFIGAVSTARPALKSKEAFTGAAWLVEGAPAGLVDEIGGLDRAVARARELADERSAGTATARAHAAPGAPAAQVVPPSITSPQSNEDHTMSLFAAIKAAFGSDKKKQARAYELASENPSITVDELKTKVEASSTAAEDPAVAAAAADGQRLAAIRARFAADPAQLTRAFTILADHPEFGAEQIGTQIAADDAAELARLRADNAKLTKAAADEKARADALTTAGLAAPVRTGAGSAGGLAATNGTAADQELTGLNRVAAAFAADTRNPANAAAHARN